MAFFIFLQILIVHSVSKQWSPDQKPHSAVSDLDLPCLPMFNKKDAKFKASMRRCFRCSHTSKTCLKQGLAKRKPKKVFKTNYRLVQVKSIAECSKRAFCNTFDLH